MTSMAPKMTSCTDHHPSLVVKLLLKNKSWVLCVVVDTCWIHVRRWSPQEIEEAWQEEVAQEVPLEDTSMDTEAFEDVS